MSNNSVVEGSEDAYPLNRDLFASARLNLQHQLWISSVGYHLHPSIPLCENALIADIGCGTGIWALEVARRLPLGGKVEAYDLSLAQCPPKGWWLHNVTFDKLDIFDPIPLHLAGRYDVVCIRHFTFMVQSGNPMPLLSALLALLKPGGYLQWQEWDLNTNRIVVSDTAGSPEETAPKLQAYMDSIKGPDSLLSHTKWVEDFHNRLKDASVQLIAHDRHWTAKEAMLIKQETTFMSAREYIDNQRARNPDSPEAAKLEKLTDEAQEECWMMQRGTVIDTEMVTWVARKE